MIGAIDEQSRLLGFASYGPFRNWPAYKYSVEHSVYVDKDCRGRGVGKLLLAAIIDARPAAAVSQRDRRHRCRERVSIALHTRFGFEFCGRVKHAGFKFGRWLDLDFYQLILDTPAQPVDG